MAIVKQSFISNLIGKDNYDGLKKNAKIIIALGTCILAILFLLTYFFHLEFLSSLLNLVTGTSLLFVAYVAALILVLDIEVDVEDPERFYWSEPIKQPKPLQYKLTIVWNVILIILGIGAIYFSNDYRKQYSFECDTYFVDHQAKIYHLDWDIDCEVAAESNHLAKMKGHQIDKSYTLCDWCEEWAEDAEAEYGASRYFRR
jgi:hypothetical protein